MIFKFFLFILFSYNVFAEQPNLFLLKNYNKDKDVVGWVMSEKLDGVRGFWTGNKLVSRNGKNFNPPAFWIENFPPFAIDGEIWNRRDNFDNISAIVRSSKNKAHWKNLSLQVFEIPNQTGNLFDRLNILRQYLKKNPSTFIDIIPQISIKNQSQLDGFLHQITKNKGEGVVVRNPYVSYQTGRLPSAMKIKKYLDNECFVVKILTGKSKYQNVMGSLKCRTIDNKIVTIGTGFTDFQRKNPPKIGTEITFKYYGLTKKGNFRFPVFMRIKQKL